MKIFYAVQATGNGHISRAMELLPHLQELGGVDIFLTGSNSHLSFNAPIKYRSRGISLYYNCHGGLDYWQLVKELRLYRLNAEISYLPVDQYDLVLNDFDFITSAACSRKHVPSVHFGHQASFQSASTPRPLRKRWTGEWLLKNYVKAESLIGFHFESYDRFIQVPIVRKEILDISPADEGFFTVYLPSWCEQQLCQILHNLPAHRFEVFCAECREERVNRNIRFLPIGRPRFTQSLAGCSGIICGAGFETPAEALHLGKKLLAIPIRGHYEQECNAAALQKMGVTCIEKPERDFSSVIANWIQTAHAVKRDYSSGVEDCMRSLRKLIAQRNMASAVLS